jgi:hypothetical protein
MESEGEMPFSEYKYDYSKLEAAIELLKFRVERAHRKGQHVLLNEEELEDILLVAGIEVDREVEVI